MKLFLDIETLPTNSNEKIDYVVKNIKAPGNYKKQEAIDKYIAIERKSVVSNTALSGIFGEVYMIGYAIDDSPVRVIREASEGDTIAQFIEDISSKGLIDDFGYCKATIVGHNAEDFDVPFLSQRMMVNQFKPLYHHATSAKIDDTMKMFACGRYKQFYKLEALCLAFGLPCSAGNMDGSKVAQYYAEGRHDEVMKYCGGDVEDMRRVYYAMTDPSKLQQISEAA